MHRSARELIFVESIWLQVQVPMHCLAQTMVIVVVVALTRVHYGALKLLGVIVVSLVRVHRGAPELLSVVSLHIPMHRLTQAIVVIAVVVPFSHQLHQSELMQRGVRVGHGRCTRGVITVL